MDKIYRATISITHVTDKPKKKFAFGVLVKKEPETAFLPYWIVTAFDITEKDQGFEFDCLYIVREEDPRPCVLAILEDRGETLPEEEVVGRYRGRPGTENFTALVNDTNRKK